MSKKAAGLLDFVQMGEGGGVGNLDKSKRTKAFFQETIPKPPMLTTQQKYVQVPQIYFESLKQFWG